jgi:hypothetical protein
MIDRQERRLRVWFLVSFISAIGVVSVPMRVFSNPVENVPLRLVIGIGLFIAIGGFYLRVLGECFSSRELRHKWAWMLLLFCVPIVSAYIYFAATRLLMNWQTGSTADTIK